MLKDFCSDQKIKLFFIDATPEAVILFKYYLNTIHILKWQP